MKELKIFNGDPIIIKGKRRHETLCIAIRDNTIQPDRIAINKCVRNNIRVRLSDLVSIRPAPEVPNLKKIHIIPFKDTIEGITGNIPQTYLQPYFRDAHRPLHKGDTFLVRGNFRAVEFKVVATEPGDFGLVSAETVLFTDGDPIIREDEEKNNEVGFEDVGGCRK